MPRSEGGIAEREGRGGGGLPHPPPPPTGEANKKQQPKNNKRKTTEGEEEGEEKGGKKRKVVQEEEAKEEEEEEKEEERIELTGAKSFSAEMIELNLRCTIPPDRVVKAFRKHYKRLFTEKIERGGTRATTFKNSAQSQLSRFKKAMRIELKKKYGEKLTPEQVKWLSELHLVKQESRELIQEKRLRTKTAGIERRIIEKPGLIFMHAVYWLWLHDEPTLQVIALEILLGRRLAEIILTGKFSDPKYPHYQRHDCWCQFSGTLKRGRNNIEMYSLAPMPWVLQALANVRKHWANVTTIKQVNDVVCPIISRRKKKVAPFIAKSHDWRKFYIKMGMQYFNEIDLPEWMFVQLYLGHSSDSGESAIPYTNFVVKEDAKFPLDYGKGDLYGKTKDEMIEAMEITKRCLESSVPQHMIEGGGGGGEKQNTKNKKTKQKKQSAEGGEDEEEEQEEEEDNNDKLTPSKRKRQQLLNLTPTQQLEVLASSTKKRTKQARTSSPGAAASKKTKTSAPSPRKATAAATATSKKSTTSSTTSSSSSQPQQHRQEAAKKKGPPTTKEGGGGGNGGNVDSLLTTPKKKRKQQENEQDGGGGGGGNDLRVFQSPGGTKKLRLTIAE